jgi:hypothetical protein
MSKRLRLMPNIAGACEVLGRFVLSMNNKRARKMTYAERDMNRTPELILCLIRDPKVGAKS